MLPYSVGLFSHYFESPATVGTGSLDDGYTVDVRCIDVSFLPDASPNPAILVGIQDAEGNYYPLLNVLENTDTFQANWQGRQIVNPGESLFATCTETGWTVRVSGYLFQGNYGTLPFG